jgi:hypothetical protein
VIIERENLKWESKWESKVRIKSENLKWESKVRS